MGGTALQVRTWKDITMADKVYFEHIAVAANPQHAGALDEAQQVAAFLIDHGLQALSGFLDDSALRTQVQSGAIDLLIAMGGDGTMLRAGHLCAPVDVPIMGINLGRFGFLTEIQKGQWRETLPRLLEGKVWFEVRMMLRAEAWRAEQKLGGWDVVNETVVGHGWIKRPVHLEAHVDDNYLATYVADGLIVATPTGSTAYALAAGGPILPPDLRNVLIVPVAPHLSIDRAVVLAEGSAVSITVITGHQPVLSVDGQTPVQLEDGDRVEVGASDHNVRFARLQDPAYFYRNLTFYLNRHPAAGLKP